MMKFLMFEKVSEIIPGGALGHLLCPWTSKIMVRSTLCKRKILRKPPAKNFMKILMFEKLSEMIAGGAPEHLLCPRTSKMISERSGSFEIEPKMRILETSKFRQKSQLVDTFWLHNSSIFSC